MKYQGITIFKNKTCNSWYARYRNNGKQFYVSAKTQLECYKKLKHAVKQKDKIQNQKEQKPTFMQWYNKWLELFKKDVKTTTKQDYKSSLAYLNSIYDKKINEITSIEIIEILNNITFERRRQKVYELLNDIFKKAYTNEIIERNPILIIDKPKHKKVNGSSLSNEDESMLEKILIQEKLDLFLICLYQGLRRGEALALTIEDINFKEKTLTINKSLNRQNEIDTTKNTYSIRTMPLFDKSINILKKFNQTTGRIFQMSYTTAEKTFCRIMKNHFPTKHYSIHSLRHTFITRCQECNIPIHIIQKWVGHVKGSNVTSSVYTHTREIAETENYKKLNNKLNSKFYSNSTQLK